MDEICKYVSLEELNKDLKELEEGKWGSYFDEKFAELSYHGENGYASVIKFFNLLRKEYNECISNHTAQTIEYRKILIKVFDWFLPILPPYYQFMVQSNICILAGDDSNDDSLKESLKDHLKRTDKLIETMSEQIVIKAGQHGKEVLCQALDVLGYFNIREHKYEYAKRCLHLCIQLLVDLDIDNFGQSELFELYINSIVQLSKCYEYANQPWEAVAHMLSMECGEDVQNEWKKIINEHAESIRNDIIHYYSLSESCNQIDDTIHTVKKVYEMMLINSDKKRHLNPFKIFNSKNELPNTLKSYVHVLAHCISEYAAKIREKEYSHPLCSTLQLVSRFLLDWLVVSCNEKTLVTCQAIVRAENDACPEALNLLLNRYKELKFPENVKNEKVEEELQEIEFFLFYFSEQELRHDYEDDKLNKIFEKYGKKFYKCATDKAKAEDFDSLFHYYVIQFKYLFKKEVDQFIHDIDGALNTKEVDNVFLEMCRCRELCSKRIFGGLIDECERLEKLFVLFQQLRGIHKEKISKSKRDLFIQLWSQYRKNEDAREIKKIISEFYMEVKKRNKILILAPVKDAPSCSSEYRQIQNILEIPLFPEEACDENAHAFVKSIDKIARKTPFIPLYSISDNYKKINLQWAIYYPKQNSFVYLYLKKMGEECNEVVPIYLDTEDKAIESILERIDDDISEELQYQVFSLGSCPKKKDECSHSHCNTFCLKSNDNYKLKGLIHELLVFLEFDFQVVFQERELENEYILIHYPDSKGYEHRSFWVLAFDGQITTKYLDGGVCDLCKNCFQECSTHVDEQHGQETGQTSTITCNASQGNKFIEIRDKVFKSIDNIRDLDLDQKKLLKEGKTISGKKSSLKYDNLGELCKCLDRCIKGQCSRNDNKSCRTMDLLDEYNF